ncbi:preprotein translocase subunit SecA [Clostridium saccharoperbutylacetonicum]|uniref:Protein translocase subunit SecA n=2 Tax=Clostridium TaxID=1485 RepID=M1MDG1_9CLOT|nr:preprotein translocase subunit SecA [Clostridium saccharoperbutylacetonicum]AGF54433.1 protein translocase subunit SecA [Clostridium saccharoperbutylacetonicum N1-4(HMT)]NRT59048.1 preprotein translocase subunit SecA [Clostridium saccharoperbutylacetonicum]NSB28236.1 preprotein translocase subunit SecA [Clostridium saccharoperbutylacetonicum]NSB41724.1 preprotein translocase subunit SecA [Clostridium saccharoperbutylacetonicum]
MGLLDAVFGTYSEREVKRLKPTIQRINELDEAMQKLSDEELKAKTVEFKERLGNGETLEDILPEAFAVVREASTRVLGMKHYDEQLMGGMVLHQGRISEMKTGEGKTLVATLPAYLNGLSGNGVHIVTVNDYLAKRDAEQMGELYGFLGLTTGVIVHELNNDQRRESYGSDITYGTNNEFGFDYLRDNMVVYKEERVQRPLNFAIVDEVDSILIDEARTPLIISGQGEKSTEFYKVADYFAKKLVAEKDFTRDEKANAVMLTDEGVRKAEVTFKVDNYADADNIELQHYVTQALKANFAMRRDKDYMVKEGEVIIVDEFTGRLMEGRRYSDGLHQAIEAKEGVKIARESKTLATITFQNYFRMYKKLAGMTGTALTEENEFREIYGLDVIVIPTHRPIARKDNPDLVFSTELGKIKAVASEVEKAHAKGQPVLVGTVSIEKSELLSSMLKKKGVPHQVLNAKFHEQEAEIISHAGEKGMVTIATNMAGRGTDIKLGEGVVELGGLKIVGTERHESRRIDNQLRGRSGRQGDPGESTFFISLEDDLMRIFGSEKIQGVVEKLGLQEEEAIESKMVSKAIENAQKKVEGNNFDIRKQLLGYDDVMNVQREVIYKQRAEVLEGEDVKEEILSMMKDIITDAVNTHITGESENYREEFLHLMVALQDICVVPGMINLPSLENLANDEIVENIYEAARKVYEQKEEEFTAERLREIERVVLLRAVDTNWMNHIDNMDHLKQGIGLQSFKQIDPVQAYQMEGSEMFNEMIGKIKEETIKLLFHVKIERTPERVRVAQETAAIHEESSSSAVGPGGHPTPGPGQSEGPVPGPVRNTDKHGRNELCSCGSGKKYKNCCGREA